MRSALARRRGVLLAIVYGSFTRRDFFRDVDVAVYTGGLAEDPLRLEASLCSELSAALGVPVDVRVVDEAPAWFKLKVARSGVVVYEGRPGAYALFLKEAVGEQQDMELKLREAALAVGSKANQARRGPRSSLW